LDARIRPPRGSHADARLCGDARDRDGGICQELAAGVNPNVRFRGEADMDCGVASSASVVNDPQETLAESKSRNAAVSRDAEVCYPFGWKRGRHWQ
jgi:hypothetical protein